MSRYVYPDFIVNMEGDFTDKSVLYIIEVEPNFYKYGVTHDLYNRLRSHYKRMKFIRIVAVYDCKFDSVMYKIETKFKRYIVLFRADRKKYGLTEIFEFPFIRMSHIAEWFTNNINDELSRPQPMNRRDMKRVEELEKSIVVMNQFLIKDKKSQ